MFFSLSAEYFRLEKDSTAYGFTKFTATVFVLEKRFLLSIIIKLL